MEHEIRLLKEREVDQKNKASGYETLLRDKIPLNEHFLALKTKYNNEKNLLDKNIEAMQENIMREEGKNKEKKNKITVYKDQNKNAEAKFNQDRDLKQNEIRQTEHRLYNEEHYKNLLKTEKDEMFSKQLELKTDNTSKSRILTKEKYHNKNDQIEKERVKEVNEINENIQKIEDEIEKEQAELEKELDRNSKPDKLLKKQKEVTMNLRQDNNKMDTDIQVAKNRIADLESRQTILNSSIRDILKDKRVIDVRHQQLEEQSTGRNQTEEMTRMQHKNEERKMRIKVENNVDSLQKRGEILMAKIEKEETISKDVLEAKLNLQTELQELEEQLKIKRETFKENRDKLIQYQVKNSTQTSLEKQLDEEDKELKENN